MAARLRTLARYRQLAIVTTAGVCLLTVAGGVVRLTGSGLGCDDWPNCNTERFIDVSSGHTAIEQLNRLLSGLIGIPTLLLVIAAFRVRPRRPGLRWPAIGVLASILANGVVGGIAVRTDLHPVLVQSHFLLAMVTLSFGVVAIRRSSERSGVPGARASTAVRCLAGALAALTAAALVTGTVVTGTGPHAGDEYVQRFGFDISAIAQKHSMTVLVALGVGAVLAWQLRRDGHDNVQRQRRLSSTLSAWIFVGLLQGAIGYMQYFNGVPELLVGIHIALATALWVMTSWLLAEALSAAVPEPAHEIAAVPVATA